MKAILAFLSGHKRKYFVAMAISLFLLNAAATAISLPGNMVANKVANTTAHPTGEWVLDKTVSNVDFYHSITICNGKPVVFLKFINRNTGKVKVGWKEIFVTRTKARVLGFNGKKELLLAPGTTTPADCTDASNKKIVIHGGDVDPMSVVEITNFIFQDISVDVL